MTQNRNGDNEFWLDRPDPLLNTILPGTAVSLVINFGDAWAAGRNFATAELLSRACIVGPVLQTRILQVGKFVRAIGVCFLPHWSRELFNVPASELVDRILPLADLWPRSEVEWLCDSLAGMEIRNSVLALQEELLERSGEAAIPSGIAHSSAVLMKLRGGVVCIEEMARTNRLSRREFGRQFSQFAGLPPKLFARITRFQSLVQALLSTDVSQWVEASSATGFYDQAHMINEFRSFTGLPPTVFFRPHRADSATDVPIVVRGRPSEWR